MKPHIASLLNAVTLIVLSVWGYFASGMASLSTLWPVLAGVALIACYGGVKAENKVIAHIAVSITLIVFLALLPPLFAALGGGSILSMMRPFIMLVTTGIAMVFFIRSFIDARKAREQG